MSSKFGNEVKKLVGKNYSKGSGTIRKLVGNLARIAKNMSSQGLQSIKDMKTKHVERFFESLKVKGLSDSTMSGYATAMREIAHAIGKDNIVPKHNINIGIERSDRYQPKVANLDKMAEVRNQLYEKNKWEALASDMSKAFGLRREEALLSNQVVEKEGKEFLVIKGAKGGRPRDVEIERADQKELIQKVQEYIKDHGQQSLIPSDLSLKQGLKKLSNDLHRSGATKENNANLHLFRHADAQQKGRDGKTDLEIAEHLGHGREAVVKHYK